MKTIRHRADSFTALLIPKPPVEADCVHLKVTENTCNAIKVIVSMRHYIVAMARETSRVRE